MLSSRRVASLYALYWWEALARYCDDGQLEIDNLPVERALPGVDIGRRNYLFAGANSGDERAAAIYGLLQSGTANLVAFGRHVIANPDLAERLRHNLPLNKYDRETFFGGTEVSYTD